MKLATYLKRKKLSVSAFAAQIDADRQRIYRYLAAERGEERGRRPDLTTALAIERVTQGSVAVEEWARPQQQRAR